MFVIFFTEEKFFFYIEDYYSKTNEIPVFQIKPQAIKKNQTMIIISTFCKKKIKKITDQPKKINKKNRTTFIKVWIN